MKRMLSLLLALLLILTLTGCGGKDPENPPAPTPSVSPAGKDGPAAQPMPDPTPAPAQEPAFLSEENLADTRWVAVEERITYADGTTARNDLYGFGYELFLFADGSAQWLRIDAADRRPLGDPYGAWSLSGERLIFSGQEDASEEACFRAEDGGLIWEKGGSVEVRLEPAELAQWLTPLTPEDLRGVWQLEFLTADGCDYGAEDLYFESFLCINTDAEGAPVAEYYYSTEFAETRLRDQALSVLWDETPEATGWAPWVAELSTGKDVERSLIYLGSAETLYVEDFYYLDGAPAVALYRYRRVPARFGHITLGEERADHNFIWLNAAEMLWVTPDDRELIEQYGLPEDLDGYDYEIVPVGEETGCTAFKDRSCFYLLNDALRPEACGWEAFVSRLLEGGMDADYWAVPSDGTGEDILLVRERCVP